jgi:hypothetical protein
MLIHTEVLLSALDGTDISVEAENNVVHRIGDGPLRIATHPSGVETQVHASCIDGLDLRQWELLRQLQQPGERLPLVIVSAEADGFRAMACGWPTKQGVRPIGSFQELQAILAEWDGREVPKGAWQAARAHLLAEAQQTIAAASVRRTGLEKASRLAQVDAARLRLREELGRMLICFEPDTDDLNGKFHRLASERNPTAERLQTVYARLSGYPEWDAFHLADLRAYRAVLTAAQVKTRLTGRELDAALADPRWVMA